MKLLILTQKIDINDDVLGFFHRWVEEFAKQCESVVVICLQKGEYDLPENVKVLSLGKEQEITNSKLQIPNKSKIQNSKLPLIRKTSKIFVKIKYIILFYKYIWQERKNYDTVFVHMNPEYAVLGGLFWRLAGKRIGLWYTHKSVDLKLRLAEKLAHRIFTASRESFRMKSPKLKILGHGICLDEFNRENLPDEKNFDIVCVGRISPIKNQMVLAEAVKILVNGENGKNLKVILVGGAGDSSYRGRVKAFVRSNKLEKNIIFAGSVPHKKIIPYYRGAKISVNLCPTGGMDKVVLESMLCGTPVIVFNKTFAEMLKGKNLVLENLNKNDLSDKISEWLEKSEEERKEIGKELKETAARLHSLNGLVKKIKNNF